MVKSNAQKNWHTYCKSEIEAVRPLLKKQGYALDESQPHIGGERYLMQAVTTTHGRKLILLGHRITDNKRAVIKIASDADGQKEIQHERECRTLLHKINFAYNVFFTPQELLYKKWQGYVVSIQEFTEQDKTFLERPIEEQFTFALNAFKAQESAHATTSKQRKTIASAYEIRDANTYLQKFTKFQTSIVSQLPQASHIQETIQKSGTELEKNAKTIEQYCGFLTHTDFVPHNFRIADGRVYLLDHSSLAFGNKYEGWARFLNFMILYNRKLEQALEMYVKDNRSDGEIKVLRLMRIYRLGEIIYYYTDKLALCDGDLLKLNKARIDFWHEILFSIINRNKLPESLITNYKKTRDSLRSEEEKQRQKNLH